MLVVIWESVIWAIHFYAVSRPRGQRDMFRALLWAWRQGYQKTNRPSGRPRFLCLPVYLVLFKANCLSHSNPMSWLGEAWIGTFQACEISYILFMLQLCFALLAYTSSFGLLFILTLGCKYFFLKHSEYRSWIGDWEADRALTIFSHPRFSRERTVPQWGYGQLWKVQHKFYWSCPTFSQCGVFPTPQFLALPSMETWKQWKKWGSLPFQKTFCNVTLLAFP